MGKRDRLIILLIAALAATVVMAFLTGCGEGSATTTSIGSSTTSSLSDDTSTTSAAPDVTTVPDGSGDVSFEQVLADSIASVGEVPKPSKVYKIGLLLGDVDDPSLATLSEGAKEAAAEYGVEVHVANVPSGDKPTATVDALGTLINEGVDAIVICITTNEDLIPGIVEAYQKGILVLDADGGVAAAAVAAEGAELQQLSLFALERQGALAGQYIVEKLGGDGGQVAMIAGVSGVPRSDARARGAYASFEMGGLQLLTSQEGSWDRSSAMDLASEILSANPDLKAFYCADNIMALAAYEAVAQAGKDGQVIVVGTGYTEEARQAVREGRLDAAVVYSPFNTGKLSIAAIVKLLEGQEIPDTATVAAKVIDEDNVDLIADWK